MAKRKRVNDKPLEEEIEPQPAEEAEVASGEPVEEEGEATSEPAEGPSEEELSPIEALQADLEAAKAEAAEYLDGWQRARAELANFRKRKERERSEMYDMARIEIIGRLLPIVDDFERALNNAPEDAEESTWFEGVVLVERKLRAMLEAEGLIEIEAEGAQFDPALHEAITQEDSDHHDEGQIIEVVRKGYTLKDKVVRPALVRVAR
jgi:molecular chaperone GrpE